MEDNGKYTRVVLVVLFIGVIAMFSIIAYTFLHEHIQATTWAETRTVTGKVAHIDTIANEKNLGGDNALFVMMDDATTRTFQFYKDGHIDILSRAKSRGRHVTITYEVSQNEEFQKITKVNVHG